jgi:hypothetical protein
MEDLIMTHRLFLIFLLITALVLPPVINGMKVSLPSKKSVAYFIGFAGAAAVTWYFWQRTVQKKTKRVVLSAELREAKQLQQPQQPVPTPVKTTLPTPQAESIVPLKQISRLEVFLKAPSNKVLESTLHWELNTDEIQRKAYLLEMYKEQETIYQLLVNYYALKEERIKKSTPNARVEALKKQEQTLVEEILKLLP